MGSEIYMKIERLSDNQIRCTLTREDLRSREIKLSELAYGSDKLKQLMHDMMQQAFQDCGFDASNTPLMIEAIPISMDSIILIITKVDDPDELDSRFARFSLEENAPSEQVAPASLNGADEIIDLISKLGKLGKSAAKQPAKEGSDMPVSSSADKAPAKAADKTAASVSETSESPEVFQLRRFYLFRDLENVIRASLQVSPSYDGPSSLFKNPEDGNYFLILQKADASPVLFNQVCNTISEYGLQADYIVGLEEFFREHMELICEGQALQMLRTI